MVNVNENEKLHYAKQLYYSYGHDDFGGTPNERLEWADSVEPTVLYSRLEQMGWTCIRGCYWVRTEFAGNY